MNDTKPIQIPSDSPLATLIAEASASGAPLTVETGGVTYELDVRSLSTSAEQVALNTPDPLEQRRSPEQFYASFTRREDVRRVLRRLAE
jgi:hypothetical protein